ncbi:MAG: hypothetical protein HY611_09345 [Elusimicrobia bacterium]|nr:hypothetical protein [Elusimicrobiota bacterium]
MKKSLSLLLVLGLALSPLQEAAAAFRGRSSRPASGRIQRPARPVKKTRGFNKPVIREEAGNPLSTMTAGKTGSRAPAADLSPHAPSATPALKKFAADMENQNAGEGKEDDIKFAYAMLRQVYDQPLGLDRQEAGGVSARPPVYGNGKQLRPLRFNGDPAKEFVVVRRIRGEPGSKWFESSRAYWRDYQAGNRVEVTTGKTRDKGQGGAFVSQVSAAKTVPIEKLSKSDLRGMEFFSERQIQSKGLGWLREKLVGILRHIDIRNAKRYGEWKNKAELRKLLSVDPVNLKSLVRVISLKSTDLIRREKEEKDRSKDKDWEPAARPDVPAVLSDGHPLREQSRYHPKVVFLDAALIREPPSARIVDYMTNLKKNGITLAVLQDGREFGSRENDDFLHKVLLKNLQPSMRNSFLSYNFVSISEGGSVISIYKNGRPSPVSVNGFSADDFRAFRRITLDLAVEQGWTPEQQEGLRENSSAGAFEIDLPEGVSAEVWKGRFQEKLAAEQLAFTPEVRLDDQGKIKFRIRKTTALDSVGRIYAAMGDQLGTRASQRESVWLTPNPELLKAVPDAVKPAEYFEKDSGIEGNALLDVEMQAILGEWTEQRPNDYRTSASSIKSYKYDRHRWIEEKLYYRRRGGTPAQTFKGHVAHYTLDWALDQIQHQGRRPTPDEITAKFYAVWEQELAEEEGPILMPERGDNLGDYKFGGAQEAIGIVDQVAAFMAQEGYEVYGREIPISYIMRKYGKNSRKVGDVLARYMFRGAFDLVLVKRDPKGEVADLVIADFKTNSVRPAWQLEKDEQVLIYRLFAVTESGKFMDASKWAELPVPYKSAGGEKRKLRGVRVVFFYPSEWVEPEFSAIALDKARGKIMREVAVMIKTTEDERAKMEARKKRQARMEERHGRSK